MGQPFGKAGRIAVYDSDSYALRLLDAGAQWVAGLKERWTLGPMMPLPAILLMT